jgi:glycerol-3-phosphate dehydrogenase
MLYPERCVFALLAEAEHLAHEKGVRFEILPHANIQWQGAAIAIQPTRSPFTDSSSMSNWRAEADSPRDEANDGCEVRNDLPSTHEFAASVCEVTPVCIVNVSGAWGDMTLKGIDAGTTPLFAGTKGSHFVTRHPVLKAALGGNGVYAETADRRLCFLLPFDDAVLIGTTDERWSGPPDTAVASDEELDYLLSLVQTVFGLTLSRSDVESHYSGVRPLPRTNDSSNAAVSRDHHLTLHRLHGVPILTLVGGKLTTFRRVGEQIADRVFKQIGVQRLASTRDMPLFGAEGFSDQVVERKRLYAEWSDEFESPPAEVAALWKLYGMRTKFVLSAVRNEPIRPIADTPFTSRVVRWVIEHEWVTTLDDLIERRMMLIFAPTLTMTSLHDLARCLVETGRLREEDLTATVDATRQRLQVHYGRVVG